MCLCDDPGNNGSLYELLVRRNGGLLCKPDLSDNLFGLPDRRINNYNRWNNLLRIWFSDVHCKRVFYFRWYQPAMAIFNKWRNDLEQLHRRDEFVVRSRANNN